MTTSSTIYAWERTEGDHIQGRGPRSLMLVRSDHPTATLSLPDALSRLAALHAADEAFEVAVLACDTRCDWAAIQRRAVLARALLALVVPHGRFVLQAPDGAPLFALLDALTDLVPRVDVSFSVQFEATGLRGPPQEVRWTPHRAVTPVAAPPLSLATDAPRRQWN